MGINYNPAIVIDGLILCLDGSNSRSYAGTGITWTDISGNNKSGTGQTGVTYSSLNSGKFILNGAESGYFSMPLVTSTITNVTMCCWVNITTKSLRGPFIVNGSFTGYAIGVGNDSYDTFGNNLIALFPGNRWISAGVSLGLGWKHVAITLDGSSLPRIYLNGQLINSYAGINPRVPTTATYIGREVGGENVGITRAFGGEIGMAQMYNRQLSDAEILQNYNAGRKKYNPEEFIVREGLLMFVDAGNINSYSGTGTTWYDLSGNRNDMTLVNGVGFSRAASGVMQLDGTNDYIQLQSFNIATTNHTIIGASRYSSPQGFGRGRIFSSFSNNWLMGHWNNYIKVYHAGGAWVSVYPSSNAGTTEWLVHTVVENYSADLWTYYCNGVQIASNSQGIEGPNGLSFGNWRQGGAGSELSNAEIGFFMVYNRILSIEEINQNLNAFKGRYGL
jgi:hypothetical protein